MRRIACVGIDFAVARITKSKVQSRRFIRRSMSSLLGGSYAGYLVEFSTSDNGLSVIPIPSRYVPDELIQWGQAPKSWEVLLSEEIENENNAETPSSLQRKTIAVLPGVGCGLDSLESIRTTDEYFLDTKKAKVNAAAESSTISTLYSEPNQVAALDTIVQSFQDTTTSTQIIRLETIFSLPIKDHRLRVSIEVQVTATHETSGNESTTQYRYKVSPSVPIRTHWERRCDTEEGDNSLKALATSVQNDANGHLDAGTVFTLIGDNLHKWEPDITRLPQHQETQDDSHNAMRVWKLPNQLTVLTGRSQTRKESDRWCLEISLGEEMHSASESSTSSSSSCGSTSTIRTVRREFRGFDCAVVKPPY